MSALTGSKVLEEWENAIQCPLPHVCALTSSKVSEEWENTVQCPLPHLCAS